MLYHEGMRRLQDRFDSRRIADRLEARLDSDSFNDDARALIARSSMFFLATADADGSPDCSYKGGAPGFVRIVDEHTLAFPDYDGNGMFRSLGNILVNPQVGLLFVDFEDPDRLRVNGQASLHADDPLLAEYPGAQLIVRVRATHVFPNCPRYVHKMTLAEPSVFVPAEGHAPPVPGWKKVPYFATELPQRPPREDPL